MLASLARRAECDETPPQSEIAPWLFGEAIPKGWVANDDATSVLKADALSRSENAPPQVVEEFLVDARRIVLGSSL